MKITIESSDGQYIGKADIDDNINKFELRNIFEYMIKTVLGNKLYN